MCLRQKIFVLKKLEMTEQQALKGAEFFKCQAYKVKKKSGTSIYKYATTYLWTKEPIKEFSREYELVVLIANFKENRQAIRLIIAYIYDPVCLESLDNTDTLCIP